jgi:hypothetical protein
MRTLTWSGGDEGETIVESVSVNLASLFRSKSVSPPDTRHISLLVEPLIEDMKSGNRLLNFKDKNASNKQQQENLNLNWLYALI